MKLTVKNFGPIKEAKDVEVSPLTVFVGPSNTGKSYMAVLVYSIVKILREGNLRHVSLRERWGGVSRAKSPAFSPNNVNDIPVLYAQSMGERWQREFIRCLGEEAHEILKKENQFSVQISDNDGQMVLDLRSPEKSRFSVIGKKKIAVELQKMVDERVKKKAALKNIDADEMREVHSVFSNDTRHEILDAVASLFLSNDKFANRLSAPYYLPANRAGIMQSHRTIVRALIESAPMAGLADGPNIPMFNGVLSNFMQELLIASDLDNRQTETTEANEIKAIGRRIEEEIMGGEIHIEMLEGRYPDFRYVMKTEDEQSHSIPLMSASSMVSELAPVVIYIRNYLEKGSVFILEEPEAHLHPGAQREIADVLVQLANAGVYVIITTHSDVVLEQIGNFIHAADAPKNAGVKILGKSIGNRALSEEKAAVYWFNKKKRAETGTVVKKVHIDPDTGIVTEDHQDVTYALYNEAVRLFNTKQKQRQND